MIYSALLLCFGAMFLFFQILCVGSCLKIYKLTYKHDLLRKSEKCPEGWKPFLRPPSGKLPSLRRALFRAVFTAPLRYMCIILAVILTTTSSAIFPLKTGLRIAKIGGGIVAYLVGVSRVRFVGDAVLAGVAPLVVVNHISWIDFIVLGATIQFGFVMSEAVSRAPIVGSGFTRLALRVGSVILDRGEAKSREAAKGKIAQRLESLLAVGVGERLLIFPEGTLTNGECVVPFKLGAFATLPPVQPLRLEFTNPHYSLADLGTMEGTAFFLCLDPTDMIFTWCKVVKPTSSDTPETLAQRVREELVKGTQMKAVTCGSFRDHLALTSAS